MGKDLRGKELGVGISQRSDGFYVGRFTTKYGQRKQKLFHKLQECRQWLADSQYQDEHSNLNFPAEMTVKAWFDYWISMKKRTVRPNTVRNYTERYEHNIDPVIGKMILSEVKPIQCQMVMNRMADEGYRTSTIYQARITLYNMLDYAYQNDVIMKNPCNGMVKSDIGKPTQKKEALTLEPRPEGVHAIGRVAGQNVITIPLGRKVAVKKVTITVTRVEGQNGANPEFAVVTQIEFLKDIVPDAPSDTSQVKGVKAVPGDGSVMLSWNSVRNVTGYSVAYGTAPDALKQTSTTKTNSATIDGLDNMKEYYFQITATNGSWKGTPSELVSATPQSMKIPGAPSNIRVESADRALRVSWGSTKDAAGRFCL